MTTHEFVSLVADMRAKQREYFRLRNPSTLEAAKRLERLVDQAAREILQPSASLLPGFERQEAVK